MTVTQVEKPKLTPKSKKLTRAQKQIFRKGTIGKTTIDQLTPLDINRAIKKDVNDDFLGFPVEPVRVAALCVLHEKKEYHDGLTLVYINVYGVILDGHHTAISHYLQGKPIPYYVVPDKKFQTLDHNILVDLISEMNAWNTTWSKMNAYQTALHLNYDLAIRIEQIIDKISASTSINTNRIQPSWVFALLNKNEGLFSSSKKLDRTSTYRNEELVNYSITPEFLNDLNLFIELVNRVKDNQRYSNMVKQVLRLVWSYQLFDVEVLLSKIDQYGFNPVTWSMSDCKHEIQRVYNMGKGRKTYQLLYKTVPAHCNFTSKVNVYDYKK